MSRRSTKSLIRGLYRRLGSWRAVSRFIGWRSPAYWARVAAYRHVRRVRLTREVRAVVLQRLAGMPPALFPRIQVLSPEELGECIRGRQCWRPLAQWQLDSFWGDSA